MEAGAFIGAVFLGLDKSPASREILAKIGFRGFDFPDAKLLAALTKWLGI